MPDLAFVLVNTAKYPDAKKVIASARNYGIKLRQTDPDKDMLSFDLDDGGILIVALMPAPHPDAPHMMVGPTSPSPEEATAAKAHFIVTALELAGEPRARDTTMAQLAAAVIENVDAVGVMLGHGVVFHKAAMYAEMAKLAAKEGQPLPCEVAIDVTAAQESKQRMSFLTHGMERYGREELYISCPIKGQGALGFVFDMVRWLLDSDKQLPTGDTVGRTPKEKVKVQRVPNPTGEGAQVIKLELP